MASPICPYFNNGTCKLSGSYQSGYQKDEYCMSRDKWLKCTNYNSKNYDAKK